MIILDSNKVRIEPPTVKSTIANLTKFKAPSKGKPPKHCVVG